MYEDEDFPRDDSYWQYRCSESEELVSELVEWIESIEDDVYMDEDVLNLLARARENAARP